MMNLWYVIRNQSEKMCIRDRDDTMNFYVPEGYVPKIDLRETQIAIKIIKDFFQRELTRQLHLTRDVYKRQILVRPLPPHHLLHRA